MKSFLWAVGLAGVGIAAAVVAIRRGVVDPGEIWGKGGLTDRAGVWLSQSLGLGDSSGVSSRGERWDEMARGEITGWVPEKDSAPSIREKGLAYIGLMNTIRRYTQSLAGYGLIYAGRPQARDYQFEAAVAEFSGPTPERFPVNDTAMQLWARTLDYSTLQLLDRRLSSLEPLNSAITVRVLQGAKN